MTQRVIVNSATGERIVVRTSAADSDGALLAFDLYLPPGGHVPGRHSHPMQEEQFTIVSGELSFRLGGESLTARAGDVVVVPPSTRHWFGNRGPTTAHVFVEVRPALRMEELLAASEAVARRPMLLRLPALARLLLSFRPELAVLPRPWPRSPR